jgi:hypothetical protein
MFDVRPRVDLLDLIHPSRFHIELNQFARQTRLLDPVNYALQTRR